MYVKRLKLYGVRGFRFDQGVDGEVCTRVAALFGLGEPLYQQLLISTVRMPVGVSADDDDGENDPCM